MRAGTQADLHTGRHATHGRTDSQQGRVVTGMCVTGQVQQAPEGSIGSLSGSMQRGASLNVPPPVGRTAGGLKGNWALFWGAVLRDHCHAGLIWNEGTRAELREALQVCMCRYSSFNLFLPEFGILAVPQPDVQHFEAYFCYL